MAKIDFFGGINNTADATALTLGDKAFMDLRDGINVDISDRNKISRRDGYSQLETGAITALWAKDDLCFYMRGRDLIRRLTSGVEETVLSDIDGPVSICETGGTTFISNKTFTWIYKGGAATFISLDPQPALTASVIPGPLAPGLYRLKSTISLDDGTELVVTPGDLDVQVTDSSTINVVCLAASYIQTVYSTTPGGDVYYKVGDIPAGESALSVTAINEYTPLEIIDTVPLRGGEHMTSFIGRTYFSKGNVVFYTKPYSPYIYNSAFDFYNFPSPVTAIVAVDTGLYISADRTYFFRGLDPSTATQVVADPYPIIPGTVVMTTLYEVSRVDTSGMQGMWRTEEGVCVGLNSGDVHKITRDTVATQAFEAGAALLRRSEGKSQYISSMLKQGGEQAAFGASDTISAEIRRNGIII